MFKNACEIWLQLVIHLETRLNRDYYAITIRNQFTIFLQINSDPC